MRREELSALRSAVFARRASASVLFDAIDHSFSLTMREEDEALRSGAETRYAMPRYAMPLMLLI
jgi:hypothetical protein